MSIDARLKEWLETFQADMLRPNIKGTADSMRAALRKGADSLEQPPPALADVREVSIPGPAGPLAGRLYTPFACGPAPGPGLVYFHGGGFVIGDRDTHDRLCRRLAAGSHVRVLSADYRLAPEHKFPAAAEDALGVYDWAAGAGAETLGFDPARLAVGGDSAGGNLAAVVAQQRKTAAHRPAFQLLIYPLLQLAETNAKRLKMLEGHLMSRAILENVRDWYLVDPDDARDLRCSPLLAPDLARLAPAYIVTAGLDPLHAEGRAYADRLAAAGVSVTHRHFANVPHGFFQFTSVFESARTGVAECAAALGAALEAREQAVNSGVSSE